MQAVCCLAVQTWRTMWEDRASKAVSMWRGRGRVGAMQLEGGVHAVCEGVSGPHGCAAGCEWCSCAPCGRTGPRRPLPPEGELRLVPRAGRSAAGLSRRSQCASARARPGVDIGWSRSVEVWWWGVMLVGDRGLRVVISVFWYAFLGCGVGVCWRGFVVCVLRFACGGSGPLEEVALPLVHFLLVHTADSSANPRERRAMRVCGWGSVVGVVSPGGCGRG